MIRLGDIRKFAIRKRTRVRFQLSNGMECIVNERGIGEVSELRERPDFDLEEEFSGSVRFILEPASEESGRSQQRPRALTRQELEEMVSAGTSTGGDDSHDHEE